MKSRKERVLSLWGIIRFPHLLVTLTALQAAGWWQGGDYYYYEPIAAWIILWLWPRWQWRLEPENRLELKVIRFTSDFNFILSLLLFPPPRRHSSSSLWIQTSIKSPVLSCETGFQIPPSLPIQICSFQLFNLIDKLRICYNGPRQLEILDENYSGQCCLGLRKRQSDCHRTAQRDWPSTAQIIRTQTRHCVRVTGT